MYVSVDRQTDEWASRDVTLQHKTGTRHVDVDHATGAPPILIYGQQVIYTDDNTISSVN